MEEDLKEEGEERPRFEAAGLRDYVFSLGFIAMWLLPILYVGLTNNPVPKGTKYLNDLYRVACLFPSAVPAWNHYYFFVKVEGGKDWIEVLESDLSRMQPFGHRTRFYRFVSGARSSKSEVLWRDLSHFIKTRYEDKHPGSSAVDSVRFMQVRYITGGAIAKPDGHWKKPLFEDTSILDQAVLGTYGFEEG